MITAIPSGGRPPTHVNATQAMTKIQNVRRYSGRNTAERTGERSNHGMNNITATAPNIKMTPPSFDEKYPGIYNARRDSLNAFWAPLYRRNHGILVADCFFEKVERHVYERRELAAGERPSFFDLRFDPNSHEPMTIACVWAHWTGEGQPALDSFAAITDNPPPEILATGHTRCVIPVKEENVREWLSPGQVGEGRLGEILSERGVPFFEHRIAA